MRWCSRRGCWRWRRHSPPLRSADGCGLRRSAADTYRCTHRRRCHFDRRRRPRRPQPPRFRRSRTDTWDCIHRRARCCRRRRLRLHRERRGRIHRRTRWPRKRPGTPRGRCSSRLVTRLTGLHDGVAARGCYAGVGAGVIIRSVAVVTRFALVKGAVSTVGERAVGRTAVAVVEVPVVTAFAGA